MFYRGPLRPKKFPQGQQRLPVDVRRLHAPHTNAARGIEHPRRDGKELPHRIAHRSAELRQFIAVPSASVDLDVPAKPRMPRIRDPPNPSCLGFLIQPSTTPSDLTRVSKTN